MTNPENENQDDFENLMENHLRRFGVWDKDVELDQEPDKGSRSKPHAKPENQKSNPMQRIKSQWERPADLEIDLHGFTADEAEFEFVQALKELEVRKLKTLRLIHGGRAGQYGPIKQKLDFLIKRVYKSKISRALADPHNDGATWIELVD